MIAATAKKHAAAFTLTVILRLVRKIVPISHRGFRILVDRHDDGLHMRPAPPFEGSLTPDIAQGVKKW